MSTKTKDHAVSNACAHLADIRGWYAKAKDADPEIIEHVEEEARESALSVCTRSGWTPVGEEYTANEYEILLTTGGPALRMTGELACGSPISAHLQHQNWGTPWIDLQEYGPDDIEPMLWFASLFYFDE